MDCARDKVNKKAGLLSFAPHRRPERDLVLFSFFFFMYKKDGVPFSLFFQASRRDYRSQR